MQYYISWAPEPWTWYKGSKEIYSPAMEKSVKIDDQLGGSTYKFEANLGYIVNT